MLMPKALSVVGSSFIIHIVAHPSMISDITALVLPGHENFSHTSIPSVDSYNNASSAYLAQVIPYKIPHSNLVIYLQSQPEAEVMQAGSFNNLMATINQNFDRVISQRGRDFPLPLQAPIITVAGLVLSVDRRYYKRTFTYGDALLVSLAIEKQMPRLNYKECFVRVFEVQPQRGPGKLPIGHFVITKIE